jgi:hypothetical protein
MAYTKKRSNEEMEAAVTLHGMKYCKTHKNEICTSTRVFRETQIDYTCYVVPHYVHDLESNTMRLVWEIIENYKTVSALMELQMDKGVMPCDKTRDMLSIKQ